MTQELACLLIGLGLLGVAKEICQLESGLIDDDHSDSSKTCVVYEGRGPDRGFWDKGSYHLYKWLEEKGK